MSLPRTSPTLRLLIPLAVGALLLTLLAPAAPASAIGSPGDYVSRVNAIRASAGVGALQVDGELTAAAAGWAQQMAASQTLSHSPDITSGISQAWLKVGENVGVGPDTGPIMDAFVASSRHYANIVDPAFNRIGVGVASGGGREWTCHRFMQVSGSSSSPPPADPAPAPAASRSKRSSTPAPSSDSGNSANSAGDTTPTTSAPAGPSMLPPQPGPPPPADSARVAAVLVALRHLTA